MSAKADPNSLQFMLEVAKAESYLRGTQKDPFTATFDYKQTCMDSGVKMQRIQKWAVTVLNFRAGKVHSRMLSMTGWEPCKE